MPELDEDFEMIAPALRTYSRLFPGSVRSNVRHGDYVRNGNVGHYLIDNENAICSRFSCGEDLPVRDIRGLFNGGQPELIAHFSRSRRSVHGRPLLYFSESLETGVGCCLEMAVIAQMLQQRMPFIDYSSLVVGYLECEDAWEYHGFNLRYRNDRHVPWRIFDAAAPDVSRSKPEHEFMLAEAKPGIGEGGRRGVFLECARWDGRRYFLPLERSSDETKRFVEG